MDFRFAIHEALRRSVKYNGSIVISMQSILDKKLLGKINNNVVASHLFLKTNDLNIAKELKLINYDKFTMNLLQSININPPNYSEIFFDTPDGCGVGRLVLSPKLYYRDTENIHDVQEIEKLMKYYKESKSITNVKAQYSLAINQLIKKYEKAA